MSNITTPPFDVLVEYADGLVIERMSIKEYNEFEQEGCKIVMAPVGPHVEITFFKDSQISKETPVPLIIGGTDLYKTLRTQGYKRVKGFKIRDYALVKYENGRWFFEPNTNPDTERIALINATVGQFDDASLTNYITDGQHTFGDLYHHRAVLTALFANQVREWEKTYELSLNKGWIDQSQYDTLSQLCGVVRSKKHADGTMFTGYFIVHFSTPAGDYSYHYPITEWDLFDNIRTVDKVGEYDGHKPEDIGRLLDLQEFMRPKMEEPNDDKDA